MPSSYTSSLRLTLPATGELNGTWGTTVNTGITQLVDTAVAGYVSIAMSDADYTLSAANGATDEARNMFVDMTGTLTAARNVICPTAEKLYFFKNSTTGGYALTLKTSGGTGISVPNGKSMVLMCDGTNVIDATSHMSSLTLASALPVASGGTGATSLTANNVLLGNGTSAVQAVAPGTSGNVLTSNGSTWQSTAPAAPAASGAVVFLSEVTASGSSTVDVETAFSSTYDAYMIVCSAGVVQTNNVLLYAQVKVGGSYDTGSNYQYHTAIPVSATGSYNALVSGGNDRISIFSTISNAASASFSFCFYVYAPASTSLAKNFTFTGVCNTNAGGMQAVTGSASNNSTSALTGVRFFASSGNIQSGKFRLYGIKNS